MNHVYLGLGTNLGHREANLQRAVTGLAGEMTLTAVSHMYETPPWGVTDQPAFLNLCLAAATTQSPHQVLSFIKSLEIALGREPTFRWGPRLIDIDLLFYDDRVLQEADLVVPHPRLHERAFVLAPLAEIAPDFVHPQRGQTVRQMLAAVDTTGIRQLPASQLRVPMFS